MSTDQETKTQADESKTNDSETRYYLNPKTGRYCKVGSKLHRRLMKEAHCVNKPKPETPPTPEITQNVQPVNRQLMLQSGVADMMADVVADNHHLLEKASQYMDDQELDRLLKQMLLEKLQAPAAKTNSRKPKTKSRKGRSKKKASKPRYKVSKAVVSSSESGSETESDSN